MRFLVLQVLKILTSNVETPYLIWDNGTRTQLLDFLTVNQQEHVKTGQSDPEYGAAFLFDAHKDELVIGSVFIRIYNEQPTFPIVVRIHSNFMVELPFT